jgi:hypothetical protein
MSYFFSKFAGQGHFVDVNLFISVGYLVLMYARTNPGQADKKQWDTGTEFSNSAHSRLLPRLHKFGLEAPRRYFSYRLRKR